MNVGTQNIIMANHVDTINYSVPTVLSGSTPHVNPSVTVKKDTTKIVEEAANPFPKNVFLRPIGVMEGVKLEATIVPKDPIIAIKPVKEVFLVKMVKSGIPFIYDADVLQENNRMGIHVFNVQAEKNGFQELAVGAILATLILVQVVN